MISHEFTLQAVLETEYSEWLDGKYLSLGSHAYSFCSEICESLRVLALMVAGSYNEFVTEEKRSQGFFVIKKINCTT